MDFQKEREAFEINFKSTQIYCRECTIRDKDILEFSKTINGYFNIVANDAWNMWLNAKTQAVPEWIDYEKQSPRTNGRYQIFIEGEQIASDWENHFGFSCPISGEALIQEKITHWSELGEDPKEPANE